MFQIYTTSLRKLLLSSDGNISLELKNEALELIERLVVLCQKFQECMIANTDVDIEDAGELFRILHTVKGLSQMANLNEMVALAHAAEDYIEFIRSEKVKLTKDILELIQDAQHVLEEVFKNFPEPIQAEMLMDAQRISSEFHEKVALVQGGGKEVVPQSSEISQHQVIKEEVELFEKFLTRIEKLYALVFKNKEFKNLEELKASSPIDNISRVGDFILMRVEGDFSLIVFAAELDEGIINNVVESTVIPLDKTPDCLKKLSTPWSDLIFGSSSKNSTKSEKETTSAESSELPKTNLPPVTSTPLIPPPPPLQKKKPLKILIPKIYLVEIQETLQNLNLKCYKIFYQMQMNFLKI